MVMGLNFFLHYILCDSVQKYNIFSTAKKMTGVLATSLQWWYVTRLCIAIDNQVAVLPVCFVLILIIVVPITSTLQSVYRSLKVRNFSLYIYSIKMFAILISVIALRQVCTLPVLLLLSLILSSHMEVQLLAAFYILKVI